MSFSGFDLFGKLALGWITDGGYIARNKYIAIGLYTMGASLLVMDYVVKWICHVDGYFRDDLGSYDGLFYTMSVICFLCGMMVIILPCVERHKR
ncbi:hypothetical protein CEXT_548921 [Caerostris extrusa]|uniref:Uncharacterized protein n=1 Tax=Caerostris extrusa TaxID=172846 RepID=A0AAV4T2E8_CAEEX|nr:hypothetical protein CEXT_548921 [Caerostris extrusa]